MATKGKSFSAATFAPPPPTLSREARSLEPAAASPIEQSMKRIMEALDGLGESIHRLRDEISPIQTAQDESKQANVGNSPVADPPFGSAPITQQLSDVFNRINALTRLTDELQRNSEL